jgi:ribosomal protein S18 acetylase RimI-like enzyme
VRAPADRDRAIAFIRAQDAALADRVEPCAWGEALLTPSLPLVHDANFLLVEALPTRVGVEELDREAEQLMGREGVGHRRVNVDDEETAARLAPEFAARGWAHEQFLVMSLQAGPDCAADPSDAREIDPELLRGMRAESIRTWMAEERLVEQLLARDARRCDVTEVRAFAVLVDGRPISHAYLYRDGPDGPDGAVAQVEDVATLPDHRGQGYARAVVTAATQAAAAAELVFLVASATDWPQHLYRKLGFEAVGTEDRFLKRRAREPGSPPWARMETASRSRG